MSKKPKYKVRKARKIKFFPCPFYDHKEVECLEKGLIYCSTCKHKRWNRENTAPIIEHLLSEGKTEGLNKVLAEHGRTIGDYGHLLKGREIDV